MASKSAVAVVTGGTAGVGRAVVRELARSGYDVAVLARGRAGLDGAAQDVRAAGRRALPVPTDVADEEQVERAADAVVRELGAISLWVNNAFTGALAFSWDLSAAEHRRITEVTYYGQVHGTQAALRRMRPRDQGVVVNIGSAMAFRAIPLQSAYCAAKSAVEGYTEAVSTELAHEGSRVAVCLVELPAVNTPQFTWNLARVPDNPMPLPPIYSPRAVASMVRFVAEHPRRTTWVGLSTVYTILGERLAPKLLDLYLARTAISAQQTQRDTPRAEPNMFAPSDDSADAGAEGPFGDQQYDRDVQSWVSAHRRSILFGTGCAAVAATLSAVLRNKR